MQALMLGPDRRLGPVSECRLNALQIGVDVGRRGRARNVCSTKPVLATRDGRPPSIFMPAISTGAFVPAFLLCVANDFMAAGDKGFALRDLRFYLSQPLAPFHFP